MSILPKVSQDEILYSEKEKNYLEALNEPLSEHFNYGNILESVPYQLSYEKYKQPRKIVVKRSELIKVISMPTKDALRYLAKRIAGSDSELVDLIYPILEGIYNSIRIYVEKKLSEIIQKISTMYEIEIEPTEEYKDKLALLLLSLAVLGDVH